ncbi:glycosyltransferase, partial [candidate division KSB1 bacterium]
MKQRGANLHCSIVIPVYNEEENVEILYKSIKDVMDRLDNTYEIIFVDDGSTDNTFAILKGLHETDRNVK